MIRISPKHRLASDLALRLGALLACLLAAGATSAAPPDPIVARLDTVLERAIEEKRIVGAVVLAARDGQVVYHRAVGMANREAGRPMRENAVFRLASVTKPIVSAAALALVDEGRLSLDDPVTKWLPSFRPRLADGRAPAITVRHLLTHTSGLGYGFAEPADGPYHRAGVSDGLDQPGLTLDENLRRLASAPLLFEPGTAWRYSLATDVLGAVVSRAGGDPLPTLVERTVTGPLGMKDASFFYPPPARLVVPYVDGSPEPARMAAVQVVPFGDGAGVRFEPGRAFDPTSYASGGGGMIGTARDVLTLLEAIRKGGGPILKPETARAMTSPQTGDLTGVASGPGWAFGYGVAVVTDPAVAQTPLSAGSYQWGGVYGHYWFVDPVRKLTVVSLSNTALEGMWGGTTKAIREAACEAANP
ncbi:serine hydrolase domain-containing protein [Paludisphaera mucosa]|uniref:Serine hydrolase n=1 Tax=Paludisphaera mucosa TaxID=3030827 RepID=A0ABT6F4L7_9BACT|nr:serine hydrolase domain-containing protein [Paludisphaera mucosa]MDG3002499.1 serine hydrolase [Paludisphaera mucosa]